MQNYDYGNVSYGTYPQRGVWGSYSSAQTASCARQSKYELGREVGSAAAVGAATLAAAWLIKKLLHD